MKLVVLSGYREYLCPAAADREALASLLRLVEPSATVPEVQWTGSEEPYHTFLYQDIEAPEDADERVGLFLEFVEDLSADGDTPFAVLPFESWGDVNAGPDPRLEHFVAAARGHFGDDAVVCRRLFLSDNTQAVLTALASEVGSKAARQTTDIAVQPLTRVSGLGELIEPLAHNYGRAVLELGHRFVTAESIFEGSGRTDLVAEVLGENKLFIRPELEPERILRALQPGGELYDVLTRPLAGLPRAPEQSDVLVEDDEQQNAG